MIILSWEASRSSLLAEGEVIHLGGGRRHHQRAKTIFLERLALVFSLQQALGVKAASNPPLQANYLHKVHLINNPLSS